MLGIAEARGSRKRTYMFLNGSSPKPRLDRTCRAICDDGYARSGEYKCVASRRPALLPKDGWLKGRFPGSYACEI